MPRGWKNRVLPFGQPMSDTATIVGMKIISETGNPPVHSPLDLMKVCMDRFASFASRPAIRYGDLAMNYAQLISNIAERRSTWPLLRAGQRAIIIENDPLEILLNVMTCWQAGAAAIVLNPKMPVGDFKNLADLLQPAWWVGDAAAGYGARSGLAPNADAAWADPSECLVLTTSGTTGRPKPVALRAAGIAFSLARLAADQQNSPDDRICVTAPLTLGGGLLTQSLASLLSGVEIHIMSPDAPPTTVQSHIRRAAINLVHGTASFHRLYQQYWNGEPFGNVRLVVQFGEPAGENLRHWLRQAYPNATIIQTYGMTELGGRICTVDMEDPRFPDGYLGTPFAYLRWHVEGASEGEVDVTGQFCVASPTALLGYPQKSGGYEDPRENGFLVTNDIVRIDKNGDIYFRGRTNRAFKRGGQFINPEAVERALCRIDGVGEAFCFPTDHKILGTVPIAKVVPEAGKALSEDTLIAACADLLERSHRPTRIEIVRNLQKSPPGKP